LEPNCSRSWGQAKNGCGPPLGRCEEVGKSAAGLVGPPLTKGPKAGRKGEGRRLVGPLEQGTEKKERKPVGSRTKRKR